MGKGWHTTGGMLYKMSELVLIVDALLVYYYILAFFPVFALHVCVVSFFFLFVLCLES